MRLGQNSIDDLCELSKYEDFPYSITRETARLYCRGIDELGSATQTYGFYYGIMLVSVVTATFCVVFPCHDGPNGKVVWVSGAYTRPDFRHKGCASTLLREIEGDAMRYGADYICLDSTADDFYKRNGFEVAPGNESRMWKRLT